METFYQSSLTATFALCNIAPVRHILEILSRKARAATVSLQVPPSFAGQGEYCFAGYCRIKVNSVCYGGAPSILKVSRSGKEL